MQQQRNYVISVAGFDPSAGAGILADIKTFEQLGVYGLGVCSAITVQTEDQFQSVRWISSEEIISQLQLLLEKYEVDVMKIGIIENFEVLIKILLFLKENFPFVKIIWDPVLKASAGFEFHAAIHYSGFLECCKNVFLITPNTEEVCALLQQTDAFVAAEKLQSFTHVFLKSYKNPDGRVQDILFEENENYNYDTMLLNGFEKHGSGCVLAAAITSFLASGNDLRSSCELAKSYTFEFLKSAPGLLGAHHSIKQFANHA